MSTLDRALIRVPGVEVRVVRRCTSTNSVLLAEQRRFGPVLLAAEEQTAGRGRRGRRWHSTPGEDITFSLGRRIERPLRELGAISLVAGVAAARALREAGVARVALKWPNDLLVDAAKLGGILVETRAHGKGVWAVIGIGINARQPPGLQARLRRPIASLDASGPVDRNALIAALGSALLQATDDFESRGFDDLRQHWEAMHAYAGRQVSVRYSDGRRVSGIAAGIADDGALRLITRSGEQYVRTGRIITGKAA